MPDVETSRPSNDLTDNNNAVVQENVGGSTEPAEDTKKVIAGFQKALQQSQESLKEYKAKLKKYEEAEKSRELESMDETERLRSENQKLVSKIARLQIDSLVDRHVAGKDIPDAVVRALKAAPFDVIPGLREEAGDSDVDEFLEVLETKLPEYLAPLIVSKPNTSSPVEPTPTNSEPTAKVDPERSTSGSVVKSHVYTRSEIARIKSMGTKEYEKHRPAIMAQLERDGGRIPE